MKSITVISGLATIIAIFAVSSYLYSHLSKKSASLSPPQTAMVFNLLDKEFPSSTDKQVAVRHSSTTAKSNPSLEGLKETELREGLDNIKAGLDLLTNPVE